MADPDKELMPARDVRSMANWLLLDKTWDSLISWLNVAWWGKVPMSELMDALRSQSYKNTLIAVSTYQGSVPGGVISMTIASCGVFTTVGVILQNGYYRIYDVTPTNGFYSADSDPGPSRDPVQLVNHVIKAVGGGRPVRGPNTVPMPNKVDLVDDMRMAIRYLGKAWLGAVANTEDNRATIQTELRKAKAPWDPALAVIYVPNNDPGYLFTIETPRRAYQVYLGSGYVMKWTERHLDPSTKQWDTHNITKWHIAFPELLGASGLIFLRNTRLKLGSP